MTLVPDNLRTRLSRAGWHAGRNVPVDPRVPADHPACQVLAELGGLCLTKRYGDYIVDEVAFKYSEWPDDLAERWEKALGTRLVAIAEGHNAHATMYMSKGGFLFQSSVVHHAFWLEGRSFGEALTNIFAGVRPRPMLLDQESSMELYGRDFTRDDPEVLTVESPELQGA